MPNTHCSILLVEGDKDLREILTRALLRRGFHVTAVEHPRQALEAVTVRRFKVAIVDEAPDELSRGRLMRKLKSQLGGLEVILLAAYWDDASRGKAANDGAFACLGKPYGLNELVKTISDANDRCAIAADSPTPAG